MTDNIGRAAAIDAVERASEAGEVRAAAVAFGPIGVKRALTEAVVAALRALPAAEDFDVQAGHGALTEADIARDYMPTIAAKYGYVKAPASEWRPRAPEAWEVQAHASAHPHSLWAYRARGHYPTWHTLNVVAGRGEAIVIDGVALLAAWQRGHSGADYEWRPYDNDGTPCAWPERRTT